MHDALFARQQDWTQQPDPAPVLESLATGAGANIAAYLACIGDTKTRNAVAASVAAGRALGFSGTPSFRMTRTTAASGTSASGEALQLSGALPADDFGEILDALIAGREPPLDPGLQGKAPLWARVEGLALDPARPGFTKAGDPIRGNAAAKVYVVEFVDYASAASRRHHEQVQPALDSKWVASGKVAWITKNLPMRVHREAPLAAVAARCAAEQGKLREMQDLLFAERARWTDVSGEGVDRSAVFAELASRAGVVMPAFQACYAGRAAMATVLRDVQDAQGVADRAPTFVVLGPKSGGAVTGPLSLEEFDKLLETTTAAGRTAASSP
jgi:protein-disulfide isomerase